MFKVFANKNTAVHKAAQLKENLPSSELVWKQLKMSLTEQSELITHTEIDLKNKKKKK